MKKQPLQTSLIKFAPVLTKQSGYTDVPNPLAPAIPSSSSTKPAVSSSPSKFPPVPEFSMTACSSKATWIFYFPLGGRLGKRVVCVIGVPKTKKICEIKKSPGSRS